MEQIHKAVKNLTLSPLFNLSLASKELFHSNFLAWSIEQKNSVSRELIKTFAPEINPVFENQFEVEREANNFDLTIIITSATGETYRIVVENKVKSIPTPQQLETYDKKLAKNPKGIDKTIKVLLSLTDSGSRKMAETLQWRYCSYEDIIACFPDNNSNSYNNLLQHDYKYFIKSLTCLRLTANEIFRQHQEALINPFTWPKRKSGSIYEVLKTIRMHDIFEKWRMLEIKTVLLEQLEQSITDELVFSVGFTKGLGLLDIYHRNAQENANKPFFNIQLQGTQLRQALIQSNAKGRELFTEAERLLTSEQWFCKGNGEPLQQCGKSENLHFCKYGNEFVYRYEQLTEISQLMTLARRLAQQPFPA